MRVQASETVSYLQFLDVGKTINMIIYKCLMQETYKPNPASNIRTILTTLK